MFPDAKNIVTSGTDDGVIAIRSTNGGKGRVLDPKYEDSVSGLAVTSDGTKLLSIDVSGKLWIWDLSAKDPSPLLRQNTGISGGTVALSHDQRQVAVAGNSRDILVYQIESSHKLTGPILCRSGSDILDDAAFGPDDKFIYAIGADRCEIVASTAIQNTKRPADDPAYRHRLVMLPRKNALALALGTDRIRLISSSPDAWLNRAGAVGYVENDNEN
jgi:WD40 repeat protein